MPAELTYTIPCCDRLWPSCCVVEGLCPRCQAEERKQSQMALDALRAAIAHEHEGICQTLGKALGYARYVDDLANFPNVTEADGVCVGPHVAATLAGEAADRIARLTADNQRLRGERGWRLNRLNDAHDAAAGAGCGEGEE